VRKTGDRTAIRLGGFAYSDLTPSERREPTRLATHTVSMPNAPTLCDERGRLAIMLSYTASLRVREPSTAFEVRAQSATDDRVSRSARRVNIHGQPASRPCFQSKSLAGMMRAVAERATFSKDKNGASSCFGSGIDATGSGFRTFAPARR
jgi:hypothetical protein